MPIQDLFTKQIDELRTFLRVPEKPVGCLGVAPDLKKVLLRVLGKLDEDPRSPHVMVGADIPFESAPQYFFGLEALLRGECLRHEQDLATFGVSIPAASPTASPEKNFFALASALANSMPRHIRSLVLVLDPTQIHSVEAYLDCLARLADRTPSRRIKYLAIDDGKVPSMQTLAARTQRATSQKFGPTPDEIEAKVRSDLAKPGALSPLEQQQYTAMLAGFAYARQQYGQAILLHQQSLEMLADKNSEEAASVLYNLGNAQMGLGEMSTAEQSYTRAVNICIDRNLDTLLPMVLTNLGLVLHLQERQQEAVRSMSVARDLCRVQGQSVTEAYVLDCLAQLYDRSGNRAEAVRCLREALSIVDAIKPEFFADLRMAGRADLLAKLARYQTVS